LSERPILLAKTPNLPLLLDQVLDELTHFSLENGHKSGYCFSLRQAASQFYFTTNSSGFQAV
ncbi:MAG TPA: hypothetical protein VGD99_10885, partial [Anaerolineae bacterium]